MKRFVTAFAVASCVLLSLLFFSACDFKLQSFTSKKSASADDDLVTVTFHDGDEVLATHYIMRKKCAYYLTIDDKDGYVFNAWLGKDGLEYDFTLPLTDSIDLYASWDLATYTATFTADGETVQEIQYDCQHTQITPPEVPEKEGYTGEWEDYELTFGDVTINAVYTAIQYNVKFYVGGELYETRQYSLDDTEIDEPEPPQMDGYTITWEEYTLDGGDKEVNAVLTQQTDDGQGAEEQGDNNPAGGEDPVDPNQGGQQQPEQHETKPDNPTTPDPDENKPDTHTDPEEPAHPQNKFSYTAQDDGSCLITGLISQGDEDIYIPAEYEGMEVYGIADNSFREQSIKTLEIAEGVKSIGKRAFYKCESLSQIILPESITSLGQYAFSMTGIESVRLSISACQLPQNVFSGCANLTRAEVRGNIKIIDSYAFFECANLKEIYISENVSEIGAYAFGYCDSLVSAEFENPDGWGQYTDGELISSLPASSLSSPLSAARTLLSDPEITYKKVN